LPRRVTGTVCRRVTLLPITHEAGTSVRLTIVLLQYSNSSTIRISFELHHVINWTWTCGPCCERREWAILVGKVGESSDRRPIVPKRACRSGGALLSERQHTHNTVGSYVEYGVRTSSTRVHEMYHVYFKRGFVPPRRILGSAVFHKFFLRNGSN
jgi:hypothetical protein